MQIRLFILFIETNILCTITFLILTRNKKFWFFSYQRKLVFSHGKKDLKIQENTFTIVKSMVKCNCYLESLMQSVMSIIRSSYIRNTFMIKRYKTIFHDVRSIFLIIYKFMIFWQNIPIAVWSISFFISVPRILGRVSISKHLEAACKRLNCIIMKSIQAIIIILTFYYYF